MVDHMDPATSLLQKATLRHNGFLTATKAKLAKQLMVDRIDPTTSKPQHTAAKGIMVL